MRLRATKIEHTFGRFGTFGCFSRAIDTVTCAPHQCRQGLPLCRAGVPRRVGQERREIGDMAPYRGLFIASTKAVAYVRMPTCQFAVQGGRRIRQIAANRQDRGGPVEVVSHHLHIAKRSEHSDEPTGSSRRCCACEPVNRGPNVARLLRSRREDTRIRFSVSGLSMRAADSRARSSSSWAYR